MGLFFLAPKNLIFYLVSRSRDHHQTDRKSEKIRGFTYLTTRPWISRAVSMIETPFISAMMWPLTACGPFTGNPHGPRLVYLDSRILYSVYAQCRLFLPDM